MHSGFLLLLWLIGVALVQFMPTGVLIGLAVACLAIAGMAAGGRLVRLLRRTRFLLLAIFVLFAWFTPGEAIFADWPHASPTREGLALAGRHLAHLAAVVGSVAVLLERLPVDRLVGGLHALCRPLAWIGLPVERIALRLLLVLRYVESSTVDGAGDWRAWLMGEGRVAGSERVRLTVEPVGVRELVLGVFVAGGLLWWKLG
ncbi:CbiQ family ECF transporter T component [Thauera sinica]|uniref:CbiQ family ECF transporter T component n=1 Tax=Thauera sinica TaxID=2665146 RepID=A0ABW1AUG1_9RHOO|nr:CbiQ family ECF transporter T component [Thauera sp. K11]ATE59294.1 hypothetical protein CCZ27_04410 [Thauera sp. K11]